MWDDDGPNRAAWERWTDELHQRRLDRQEARSDELRAMSDEEYAAWVAEQGRLLAEEEEKERYR